MYILCLIGLWTRSPKTEVEKLRIERLDVFKCLRRFCKFGKVQVFEKERKKKKFFLHFASALFSKDMLRAVKRFAPWILFDCFEEKFLYPLECREVPSGS